MGSAGEHDRTEMKSEVIGNLASQAVSKKRSVVVAGHRTSVSLEPIFWDQLREIAAQRRISVNELVTLIDQQRNGSLSSAIRVFVLETVRK
jgi:predicted DNA-binding ribbon-helix-helix protein